MKTWKELRLVEPNKKADMKKKCGHVAIVGKPNVGKSTLLNMMLKQKISITSRKPQTTRHQILGIQTSYQNQIIYVDTPGLHKSNPKKAINRYMNRAAFGALRNVDVVIAVFDRNRWTADDTLLHMHLKSIACPVIIAINKTDRLEKKEILLPYLKNLQEELPVAEIIPISAKKGTNLNKLQHLIQRQLPQRDHIFSEDQVTNHSARFISAEFIREKIIRQLGDELPYQVTVSIEALNQKNNIMHIEALILVERKGQKIIIIGKKGSRLQAIGTEARQEMEQFFNRKIMLSLWVKIKCGWSDDEKALKSLGYDELF